jgi:cytoskeletal protein CcmA (bactofilin family)
MFKRRDRTSQRIDTLVGRSVRVQGDIEFTGGLHIDGRVTGNVRVAAGGSGSLSVSEHGVIEGSVEASQVVLNGTVTATLPGARKWSWAPGPRCVATSATA